MRTSPRPSDPARAAFLRLSAAALGLGLAACAQAPYRGRHRRELAAPAAEARLEESLAEFRDDLNLTASQRPSWDHYAGALRAFARDAERERSRARTFADMTLQQRIDHQVEAARGRGIWGPLTGARWAASTATRSALRLAGWPAGARPWRRGGLR